MHTKWKADGGEESNVHDGTGFENLQDAIALQKWLGVHIFPRVVAISTLTAREFCASHLGTEVAMEDIYKVGSLDGFLALCKEHFFKDMTEMIGLVLPNVDQSERLLTHPYKLNVQK